jgi:transcriptional regulator with XRE-family HTH domain
MVFYSTRREQSSTFQKILSAATVVEMNLRAHRISLGLSQSRLARRSGVSRFKICTNELGGGSLTAEEESRIREAFRAEADRLRRISADIDCSRLFAIEEPLELG